MPESNEGRLDRRKVDALESIAKSLKAIAEPGRHAPRLSDADRESIVGLTESGVEPMSDRD